jgi:hypothetical protein
MGSIFNTGEFNGMSVHNLTLEELNTARNKENTNSIETTNGDDDAKGLFYLKDYGWSRISL